MTAYEVLSLLGQFGLLLIAMLTFIVIFAYLIKKSNRPSDQGQRLLFSLDKGTIGNCFYPICGC